jgi:hypothetical protein
MLSRVVLAVVAAVIAYLICVFVGGVLLVQLQIPIAVAVGRFLEQYAPVISVLAGLWYFFSGGTILRRFG